MAHQFILEKFAAQVVVHYLSQLCLQRVCYNIISTYSYGGLFFLCCFRLFLYRVGVNYNSVAVAGAISNYLGIIENGLGIVACFFRDRVAYSIF